MGSVKGDTGALFLDAQLLGRGPVELTAVAVGASPDDKVFGPPILVRVEDSVSITNSVGKGRSGVAEQRRGQ
jgi:hypothetical protein